jgi:hypothetical protein
MKTAHRYEVIGVVTPNATPQRSRISTHSAENKAEEENLHRQLRRKQMQHEPSRQVEANEDQGGNSIGPPEVHERLR